MERVWYCVDQALPQLSRSCVRQAPWISLLRSWLLQSLLASLSRNLYPRRAARVLWDQAQSSLPRGARQSHLGELSQEPLRQVPNCRLPTSVL